MLDWDLSGEFELAEIEEISIPYVKGNSITGAKLPSFFDIWSVTNNSKVVNSELTNVVYKKLDLSKYPDLDITKVPLELEYNLVVSDSRSDSYISFELTPLIKIGNEVSRVVSFNLEYQLGSFSNKQSKLNRAVVAQNSVLSSGTWYKFAVDTTGVFKIDKNLLNSIGVDTNGLDPRSIRIYGNGGALLPQLNSDFRYDDLQENHIYVQGESDGVFNDSDYILFYAKGPHGWDTSDVNNLEHINNIYSDLAYYFITIDNGFGQRISNETPIVEFPTKTITKFDDYTFLEEDKVNLIGTGQHWFGDEFGVTNSRDYKFRFSNIDTSVPLEVRVRGAVSSTTRTAMEVTMNSESYTISSTGGYRPKWFSGGNSFLVGNEDIVVTLEYHQGGNPAARSYLDYIELIGTKNLVATGSQFAFRNFEAKEVGDVLEYVIANENNVFEVWDVTSFLEPKRVANLSPGSSNYSFRVNSGELREYVVLNNSNYYAPIAISDNIVSNQNLHGELDIDYLVVTNTELLSEAQRLASYHQQNSGLNTKVVDLKLIYNEFGSGAKDITAIRDYVRYLYNNSTNKIKYLCLFGDGTYDFKDRISNNNNVVPAYQEEESFDLINSFVTDDYYGMMGESEGRMVNSDKQDVATGRILVSTTQEAREVVDKILNYYSEASLGVWHNTITLIADDSDSTGSGTDYEREFQEKMDDIAKDILENRPQYNIKKIYSDAYEEEKTSGGDRYPEVKTEISDVMEKGSLLIGYFGHGGETGLASERIVDIPQIRSWRNNNTLPLFITITCDFTRFDNPQRFTAGEEMFSSPIGGAISLLSTTREILARSGRDFNEVFMENVLDYENEGYSISEALMMSKNENPLSQSQHFFIYYFGDPAMKLRISKPNIRITKINDKDVLISRDTLKSLAKVKLEGVVTNEEGDVLTNYGGVVSTVVYDKPFFKTTLDNVGYGETFEFEVQESKIFNGQAEVNNGVFEVEFIVPQDIKVDYGKGKVSLYAYNYNEFSEKGGADLDIVVGGIDENDRIDEVGPEIIAYMNDEFFTDGGTVNQSPVLHLEFSDESGINTSLGGIGHDIVAVLDGNRGEPIQLNDFFKAEINDFTSGSLSYTLRDLEIGSHSLKIKAWDTYNNSSEITLNFVVADDTAFVIENVLNYPNPFINYTEFWFNHNKPHETLEVRVEIYTVSGSLIKTIDQTVQSVGNLSRLVTWDGLDDFGNRVAKGVYIYKLSVMSTVTGARAGKYEKLVILQ